MDIDLGADQVIRRCSTLLLLTFSLSLIACGGGDADNSNTTGLGNSQAPSNSATLEWDAPPATNISGYRIYYGTAPGTYQQPYGQGISVGNVTSHTIKGLSNGSTYYFAVTAYDTSNVESSYSNEVWTAVP